MKQQDVNFLSEAEAARKDEIQETVNRYAEAFLNKLFPGNQADDAISLEVGDVANMVMQAFVDGAQWADDNQDSRFN